MVRKSDYVCLDCGSGYSVAEFRTNSSCRKCGGRLVTRAAARQTDKGKIIKVWQKASPSAKAQERRVTPYYSMADLSYEVIKTNRKPMYYRDILKRILPKLSHLTGKTPADTLNALLHRDARFVPLGEGIFGLREWQATK